METQTAHRSQILLPKKPLVVIEPGKAWSAINLRDLWAYRELFYFLMWRDVKVRYKQTALGVIWILAQPLLITLVFTVFLGILARVPSDNIPYALFFFTGFLPWTFFSSAIIGSGNSLVASAHLITKVYFPRIIIPGAFIGGRLLDFAISLVILMFMMVYYRVWPTPKFVLLLPLIVLLTMFSWAFGMWISALNVRYRDVGLILPVVVQIWMFVSPVAYPVSLVPARWRWLYLANPIAGIIEGFRGAILGSNINWSALAYCVGLTVVFFGYSAYSFRRMERTFADII